jgi:IS30 family transposase
MTVQERAQLRRLHQEGYTVREIARVMGRAFRGLYPQLRSLPTEPDHEVEPPDYEPCAGRLRLRDREEIVIGLVRDESFAAIATRIGRDPSTVSREVSANGGPKAYRATKAHEAACRKAKRPKPRKLAMRPALAAQVIEWLEELWSPEEIARRLPVDYPHDPMMRVSHETIYQSVFVQGRGELRRELHRCLRSGRAARRPQHRVERRGSIPDKVMISERPAEVEDRAVPGHWEGDLIIGKNSHSAVGTMVERTSHFLMLLHLPADHGAEAVRVAMTAAIKRLPDQLARSVTWDQGSEMAQHKQFSIDTGLQLFFCDPHSPWQRGLNENTNGLLRQYMPKGTDLSVHTADDLDRIARSLNNRPRKTLGWLKPDEKIAELLALTG